MIVSGVFFLVLVVAVITAWKATKSTNSFTSNSVPESLKQRNTDSFVSNAKVIVSAISASTLFATTALADGKKPKKPKVLETDLGINYIMVEKGSGAYPSTGDFIVLDYIGFLANGTVFDSTEVKGRKPLSFRYGEKQMIPGIESVLSYMQPGGVATCTIPPKYAYGEKGVCVEGQGCIVPPNETLKYVLKLKNVGAGYN